MNNLKASPALQRALEQSASRPVSHDERQGQRISFIMGTLGRNSSVQRKDVEEYVARQMGTSVPAR